MCTGGLKAVLVVPSPKLHRYDVMGPVDLLMNITFKGELPEVTFALKFETGTETLPFTLIVALTLLLPLGLLTVKVAVYVPALV